MLVFDTALERWLQYADDWFPYTGDEKAGTDHTVMKVLFFFDQADLVQAELDPPVNAHPHLQFFNVTITGVLWKTGRCGDFLCKLYIEYTTAEPLLFLCEG